MLKSIVNKFLKAALNELFIDAAHDSVQVSMGSDLFTESNINLRGLTFRPDLFDALLQPLKLVSGHLGMLNINGIAELALGSGRIQCQVDNVCLLFTVDAMADAEQVQFLKKMLIELQTGNLQHALVRELLKRIQGFPIAKDNDLKKKRSLVTRILKYLFRDILITIRKVHIRIEIPCRGLRENSMYCSSIGVVLPLLKVTPGAQTRPEGVGKADPVLSLAMKNLQVYCDYDSESFVANGTDPAHVLSQFRDRWTEIHTAMLLPFDMEIFVAAEIRRRSGLVTPKLLVVLPNIRVACDPRQLEVLQDLLDLIITATRRFIIFPSIMCSLHLKK